MLTEKKIDRKFCKILQDYFNQDLDDFKAIRLRHKDGDNLINININTGYKTSIKGLRGVKIDCKVDINGDIYYIPSRIVNNYNDFIEGIYFEIIRPYYNPNPYLFKISAKTTGSERMDFIYGKFKYLENRIRTDKYYCKYIIYDKSLVDYKDNVDLLYALLLDKIIHDDNSVLNKKKDYIIGKFEYFGYDEVSPKVKSLGVTISMKQVFEYLLYYVTSELYGKGRKAKIDIYELKNIYERYIKLKDTELRTGAI